MNGTGFGFPTYPQRPSVKPQQVGQALQQMQQPTNPPLDPVSAASFGGPSTPPPAPVSPYAGVPAFAPDATAARKPQDPDPDPAIKLAVTEAMQRMATGGPSTGQQGTGNPRNAEQLARLGLSPLEIKLLWMSGGARY